MDNKESRFLQLIDEHRNMLFKICRIYEDDPDDRNDLLQEMTLQLWLAFGSFRGESKFSSWMYRVALNTAISFFKKQKRRPDNEKLSYDFDVPDEASQSAEKENELAIFYKAMQQLNKVEKALVYLYMENQPYEEIAANMGISEGNARVRINRIKNKLKDIIKKMNDEY